MIYLSTFTMQQGVGQTSVTFGDISAIVHTNSGYAPDPNPASIRCDTNAGNDNIVVDIHEEAANPLMFFSPPIEINYSIRFAFFANSPGSIMVERDIDRFPHHEVHIAINNIPTVTSRGSTRQHITSVMQLQQEPLGPTRTPIDLAWNSIRSVHYQPQVLPAGNSDCITRNQTDSNPPNKNPELLIPIEFVRGCLFT